ncbi:MAG TPA: hypothetical protein VJV78_09640 [Polyangiales bacterium]|nr:hypothetical protein [Polyangiales bacterium]
MSGPANFSQAASALSEASRHCQNKNSGVPASNVPSLGAVGSVKLARDPGRFARLFFLRIEGALEPASGSFGMNAI